MAKLDEFDMFHNPTLPRSAAADAKPPLPAATFREPTFATSLSGVPAPYEPADESPALTGKDRSHLAACEAAIDTLRAAFWAAGKALQVIRDARLYREAHSSFEEYCQERWDMTRQQASRLILAWPLAERLSPIGDKINEGQVRELLPLAEQHGQDAAVTVYRTIAEADGVKVTAAVIKGAVAVLPEDGDFDAEEAVAQIRAYLAGELAPPAAVAASPEQRAKEVGDRIRRLVNPKLIRAVSQPARKELAAELRALVEELEKEDEGE